MEGRAGWTEIVRIEIHSRLLVASGIPARKVTSWEFRFNSGSWIASVRKSHSSYQSSLSTTINTAMADIEVDQAGKLYYTLLGSYLTFQKLRTNHPSTSTKISIRNNLEMSSFKREMRRQNASTFDSPSLGRSRASSPTFPLLPLPTW